MDGAQPLQEVMIILMPLTMPGIASTALLSIRSLSWNEAFWSLNLTTSQAGAADRVHRLLLGARKACSGPSSPRPSAMAIAPILIFGWMSQRQLVRGLTFGAVK